MTELDNADSQAKKQDKKTENRESVQKLPLNLDDEIFIEYKGTPVLTTANKIEYYRKQVEKVTELESELERQIGYKNRYKIERNKAVDENNKLMNALMESRLIQKEQAKKIKEQEAMIDQQSQVIRELELDLLKYAKFIQNQKRGKPSVLTAQHKSWIYKHVVLGKSVKEIHQKFVAVANKQGDKRLASISYETIRAVVSEIRAKEE